MLHNEEFMREGAGMAPMGTTSGSPPPMSMQMSFDWSTDVTVLFSWWKTESWYAYLFTCLSWILITIFFEWLSAARHQFKHRLRARYVEKSLHDGDERTHVPLLPSGSSEYVPLRNADYFNLTLLYVLQMTLSYAIMLVIMTYNVGLGISCMVGYGIGFFFFGRDVPDKKANCHAV